MNNKILQISIITLSILISPFITSGMDNSSRTEIINSLEKGEEIKNGHDKYIFIPGLKALNSEISTSNSKSNLLRSESSGDEILGKKGRFSIYRSNSSGINSRKASKQHIGKNSERPVVQNRRTGRLAVVTGNIIVKLKDIGTAQNIAKTYNLELSFTNKFMKTAFFSSLDLSNLPALKNNLENDSRVIRVNLEIVDKIRKTR